MQINIGIIRRCEQSFFREKLSGMDLKSIDVIVLRALSRQGSCNQETLCSIVDIDKGRMAHVMKTLESGGLIRRFINPSNKREKLIEITKRGMELLEKTKQYSEEWSNRCFLGFSEEEKEQYYSYLERIAKNALAGKEPHKHD